MGLLDSVLGAVMGGNPSQPQGGGSGLGGIIGALAGNPQMLQVVAGMLGNDGAHGGLSGLIQKFQQAGLGDVMGSWVGSGENKAISGDQMSQALGPSAVSELAANAVQHARTSFSVEVRQESGLAWVCVRDGHPAVPVLRHTSAITAGGRGLALIDAGPAPGGSHPHAYRKAGMGHHRHLLKLTKFGRDPPGAHLSSGCV